MPRKKLTPAEKKAWGQKMKEAKKAKRAEEMAPLPLDLSASAPEVISQDDDIETLKRQVQELKDMLFFQQRPQAQPTSGVAQVTSRGIVGTITKYSTNPKDYPDPRDRLFEEKRLQLKGFNRDWWDLEWIVSRVNYETKDGINTAEPKFQLKLIRIIEDPETGEPSNRRYTLWKGTFFEDPEAAIQVAFQHGIEVAEELQRDFLNEMRYLRFRDWLLEAFYPAKPIQAKVNKVETVIGNRLVEVYEVNSQESETIPFGNLTKKL
jgi:hypothetical protein